jgi:hypothetical protein
MRIGRELGVLSVRNIRFVLENDLAVVRVGVRPMISVEGSCMDSSMIIIAFADINMRKAGRARRTERHSLWGHTIIWIDIPVTWRFISCRLHDHTAKH